MPHKTFSFIAIATIFLTLSCNAPSNVGIQSSVLQGNPFDSRGYYHPVITRDRLRYPNLPDPVLTPGVRMNGVTREQVCVTGYTKQVRHTSLVTKKAVFAAYHIQDVQNKYEVDHYIPLELGGADTTDTSNLFPQPYDITWNAHIKDQEENFLHRKVCHGEMALGQAQICIAQDWIACYKKWINPSPLPVGAKVNPY